MNVANRSEFDVLKRENRFLTLTAGKVWWRNTKLFGLLGESHTLLSILGRVL